MTSQGEIREWLSGGPGASVRLRAAGLQAVSWNEGERVLIWVTPGTTEDVMTVIDQQFPGAIVDVPEGTIRGITT